MYKKVIYLLTCVFVLSLAGGASAATYVWDNDGGSSGQNWDTAANWNPDTEPGVGDAAKVNASNTGGTYGDGSWPVITTINEVNKVLIGTGAIGELTITGGLLKCNEEFLIGHDNIGNLAGVIHLQGGGIEVNSINLAVANSGNAFLNMTGGTITTTGGKELRIGKAWPGQGGQWREGVMFFHGGTADVNYLGMKYHAYHESTNHNYAESYLDITTGVMTIRNGVKIPGNGWPTETKTGSAAVTQLNTWISSGDITAYGIWNGSSTYANGMNKLFTPSWAEVVVDHNLATDVITLSANILPSANARQPYPFDEDTVYHEGLVLHWTPGDDATVSDVYFGTDFNDVKNAIWSDTEYRVGGAPNDYSAGSLETLVFDSDNPVSYYWRIDSNDPNNVFKGDTWSFTIGCPTTQPAHDYTNDCQVNLDDFAELAHNWTEDPVLFPPE